MDSQSLDAQLAPLRTKIDAIDAQLISLLNARAAVALEVGEVKKHVNAPVFRPEREQQVISQLQAISEGPLRAEHIASIWREVMSASRALEKQSVAAFLGPVGTYSEMAAIAYFGQAIQGLPCPSIDEVFRSVEAGSAEFGVVPVENSTEGAVSRTLDLLLNTSAPITGEIALPIHHNLLSLSKGFEEIRVVCAHPQALAQCQRWLATHLPAVERRAVSSNAEGARMAAADPSVAAIAGDRAAAHYGLQTMAALIQDDATNRTRFYVLGGTPPAPTGSDQTSMILSVKNEPGAVYKMLEPFAAFGVSMTRFESRPARSGSWAYYFYIDIEGHRDDVKVKGALDALGKIAAFVRIIGSYPRSR
jgi:chorismate mutase/prephenate dehydratase